MPPRSGGQNVLSNVQSWHDRCRELGQQQHCRNDTVSIKFVLLTRRKCGIRWTETIQSEYRASSVTPGSAQAGHDSYRDLCHIATILAQTLRCNRSSGYRPRDGIRCRISTPMSIQVFFRSGDCFGNNVAKFSSRETWSSISRCPSRKRAVWKLRPPRPK